MSKQDRSSSSGSHRSSSRHSGSHHSGSHHSNGSVRKPSRQSSIRSSANGSVRGSYRESRGSVSVPGGKSTMHGSSAHSLADDVSLYITPMIQPLSQTDSVLNSKVSYNLISTKMQGFLFWQCNWKTSGGKFMKTNP